MGQIPRNDLISQLDLYCVVVRTTQVLVTQCARKIIGEKNFGELNAIRQIRQSFLPSKFFTTKVFYYTVLYIYTGVRFEIT